LGRGKGEEWIEVRGIDRRELRESEDRVEDPEKGGEKYQRGMSRCLRNVPSTPVESQNRLIWHESLGESDRDLCLGGGEIYCVSCCDEGNTYCITQACCNSATLGYRRSACSSRNSIHRFKYVLPLLDYSSAIALNKNRSLAVLELYWAAK